MSQIEEKLIKVVQDSSMLSGGISENWCPVTDNMFDHHVWDNHIDRWGAWWDDIIKVSLKVEDGYYVIRYGQCGEDNALDWCTSIKGKTRFDLYIPQPAPKNWMELLYDCYCYVWNYHGDRAEGPLQGERVEVSVYTLITDEIACHIQVWINFYEKIYNWTDIFLLSNVEKRREYLEAMTYRMFVNQAVCQGCFHVRHRDRKYGMELLEVFPPEGVNKTFTRWKSGLGGYGGLYHREEITEHWEPWVFLRVKDSSHPDREYLLRVPPRFKKCRDAVAWTFGMTRQEYQPCLET